MDNAKIALVGGFVVVVVVVLLSLVLFLVR